MRILILSLLAVLALALAGCGGSSSSSGSSALSGQSTCTDWNGSQTADKNAFLESKDLDTGEGSEGDAILAWMDYLCGKTNSSTQFSSLAAIDDVFPAAKQQFTTGTPYPPTAKKTTSSSN